MAMKCNKDLYQSYLQVTSVRHSGLALSEVSPIDLSHDAVSYWLKQSSSKPSMVWKAVNPLIGDREGLLIFDDSVLAKRRSKKIELVKAQYSGNAHQVIAGIGMVNAVWKSIDGDEYLPVDFRLYDKANDGKTKNDHFREMLKLAITRGIAFKIVVVDTWYSSLNNLKAVRDRGKVWVAGLKKNRKVNKGNELGKLSIPDEGLRVHLRGYGWIRVFKFVAKNGRIDYIGTNMSEPTREEIEQIVKARWAVEVYHRELKQTCGIERCQSRTGRAQRNHICLAVLAWVRQHGKRLASGESFYQQSWNVIRNAIASQLRMIVPT